MCWMWYAHCIFLSKIYSKIEMTWAPISLTHLLQRIKGEGREEGRKNVSWLFRTLPLGVINMHTDFQPVFPLSVSYLAYWCFHVLTWSRLRTQLQRHSLIETLYQTYERGAHIITPFVDKEREVFPRSRHYTMVVAIPKPNFVQLGSLYTTLFPRK